MLTRLAVCVLLVAFLTGAGMIAKPFLAVSSGEAPIRAVKIVVPKGARDEYVHEIRKFASADAFAIRVSQSSPASEDVLIQLWRSDVMMVSGNASDTGAQDITFEIGIYKNANVPISASSIDRLIVDLRNTVGRVKGATFSQTK
jgi:hypothetical protein